MTLFAALLTSVIAFFNPGILCYGVSLFLLGIIYVFCPILYWVLAAMGVLLMIWKLIR